MQQERLTRSVLGLGLALRQLGPRDSGVTLSSGKVLTQAQAVDSHLRTVRLKARLDVERPRSVPLIVLRPSHPVAIRGPVRPAFPANGQHPPKHIPLPTLSVQSHPLALDLLLQSQDELVRLLDRSVLLASPPRPRVVLRTLHLGAHLARNPEKLLVLHLELVDGLERDEVSADDRVRVARRFGAREDLGFRLVKVVRSATAGADGGDAELAEEGADLAAEVGELGGGDRGFGGEAVDVECGGGGAAVGGFAVGEGFGELGRERCGFEGEAVVLFALLLEDRSLRKKVKG